MRFSLDDGAYAPTIAHIKEDAGIDLKTPIDITIPAGGSAVIDTGVHVELPPNTFGKLESKSGLNVKHGVVSLGGVIDEGYTGSIVTRIYNFGNEDYHFNAGDKIVQMVIIPVVYVNGLYKVPLFDIKEANAGVRADSGLGSTGK